MNLALDAYPSLQTLTVGVSGCLVVAPCASLHPNLKNCGSLEQINLLACTLGAEGFLAWVAGELRHGDGLRRLKKVVVKKCESTKERQLLDFFAADKLDFEGTEALEIEMSAK